MSAVQNWRGGPSGPPGPGLNTRRSIVFSWLSALGFGLSVLSVGVALTAANPQPPRRIVSLIPAVTEMLFAVGAGDRVVGVSSFDHYPPAVDQRTRVGGLVDPDFERILALRPDLVIVYGTQSGLIQRLDRTGIPMFHYELGTLADIPRTIRTLGNQVGLPDAADRVAAGIERGIDRIRREHAGQPRPRTMVVFDREAGSLRGMYASGGVGFLHDMLTVAGGDNVFADVTGQRLQLSSETVLARAPEVIIELHSGEPWPPAQVRRELDVWNTLSSVPAVRIHRVFILVDDKLSIPGPRVVESIQALADVLHR